MRKTLPVLLMTFALYLLASKAFAWYLIVRYTSLGYGLSAIGMLSASGAFGLAIGQYVNMSLLFRLGPHRLVTIAGISASILLALCFASPMLYRDLFARFCLGWVDGMMFLVIETALVLYAPEEIRAKALAAYLFTLYAMQILSPMIEPYMMEKSIFAIGILCLSSITAIFSFKTVPSFLKGQVPSYDWNLGEVKFIKQGMVGAGLCVLSGALLPLWMAFLPTYLVPYSTVSIASMAAIFQAGGLTGQVLLFIIKSQLSSTQCAKGFLAAGIASCSFLLLNPVGAASIGLPFVIFILAVAICPVHALGLDLALEEIDSSLWIRANKTLLSCYTVPAVLVPLLFTYAPENLTYILPGVTFSLLVVAMIALGRHTLHVPVLNDFKRNVSD